MSKHSGSPSGTLPGYVPSKYAQWIETASAETGLPMQIVAAQIQDESGFQPDVTSSAGAEGFAQFLPSTYAAEGGKGSPYVANNELQPYINLTNQNLKWSGGNVEKALAAYNAGEHNWRAGLGYADTILGNANEPLSSTATPGDVNVSGDGGSNSSSTPATGSLGFGPFSISYDVIERFGLVVLGGLLILVGIWLLAGKQSIKLVMQGAKTAAKAA